MSNLDGKLADKAEALYSRHHIRMDAEMLNSHRELERLSTFNSNAEVLFALVHVDSKQQVGKW